MKTASVASVLTVLLAMTACKKDAPDGAGPVKIDPAGGGGSAAANPPTPTPTPTPTAGDLVATAGVIAYCHIPASAMCAQYPTGSSAADMAEARTDCDEAGGSWSTAGCPGAGVLGTCGNPVRAKGVTIKVYGGTSFASAAEAKEAMCSDEGDEFTPAK